MPDDKGIHVKSAGVKGEKYVYKYVKCFRNSKGEPRNMSKAIGKFDPADNKMHLNNNYFDMYQMDPLLTEFSVWVYVYSYLVLKVCRDSNLLDYLQEAFKENALDIIVMASCILREGTSTDGIDDWLQSNYYPGYARILTSKSSSRIFASLSDK